VGRQVELFEVIHSVLNHRLVNIMGLPGIGKTALAKNAVNYMKDRRLFKLGIIFFSLKGYKSTNVFMKKVVTNLVREKFELEPQERKDIEENDFEKLLSMVTGYFKTIDERLLVVFDNAEELLYYDNLNFREFLTQLLHAGPNASFLMTSRVTIGVL
jgi:predicted ATPase